MLFGTVGEPPDPSVARLSTRDYSVAEAVRAGRPVRVDETATELDRRYAGDRALLAVGLHSCLWVPMHFGDEVGGALLFGKHEAYWYDDVDVEVATVVAIRMVLGIQHQRLAEEQRRLASVERRARALEQSLKSARSELHRRYGFEQIIGQSPILREALTRGAQVARTEATVLITGESGTGKELVARAIHDAAPAPRARSSPSTARRFPTRSSSPSCSATSGAPSPAPTARSPGASSWPTAGRCSSTRSASSRRGAGRSSSACSRSGSTERVGGTATLKADVRLIAATNRDLMAEITAGRFRSDLFYRLAVFNVHLPPLRERGDDVPLLADYFIRSLAAKMGKADVTLSRDAREMLQRHPWPGNIRELQNAIERGLITCEDTLVTAAHLAIPTPSEPTTPPRHTRPVPPAAGSGALQELERKAIIDALQRAHGHKSRAAALLGLTRFQLYSRLKRHHIDNTRDE